MLVARAFHGAIKEELIYPDDDNEAPQVATSKIYPSTHRTNENVDHSVFIGDSYRQSSNVSKSYHGAEENTLAQKKTVSSTKRKFFRDVVIKTETTNASTQKRFQLC